MYQRYVRYVLNEPVVISGQSLLGLRAEIRLERTQEPGWWIAMDGTDVKLSPALLGTGHRHLTLQSGAWKTRIVEHLLPLRFFGLDNVRIVFVKRKRMPYRGTGKEFVQAVKQQMRPDGMLESYTLNTSYRVQVRDGWGTLEFEPRTSGGLEFQVTIDYPNDPAIKFDTFRWTLSRDMLNRWAQAKGLGHFHPLRPFLRKLSAIGWAHADQWVWRGDLSPWEMAYSLAEHRLWDYLGALAVALPDGGMPIGLVNMYVASHADDVRQIRFIDQTGWHRVESRQLQMA